MGTPLGSKGIPYSRLFIMRERIMWADVVARKVDDYKEWNSLIEWYKMHGSQIWESKTRGIDWFDDNSWQADWDDHGNYTLYVTNDERRTHKSYISKYLFKHKESARVTGMQSYKYLHDSFKFRTGKTLRVAFGAVSRDYFRGFQYGPIVFVNPLMLDQTINHTYKIDVSSAYADQACKMMPDAPHSKNEVRLEYGRMKPTPNYPFCFYLKSNQLAIYGELDTHDWLNHPCNKELIMDPDLFKKRNEDKYRYPYDNRFHYIPTKDSDEMTLMMKASEYTMEPEFRHMYNSRMMNPDFKDMMVMSIGAMSSPNPFCNRNSHARHITACVYARHMIKMMKLYDEVIASGAGVISMATDSIMWRLGKDNGIGVKEKTMGAPIREFTDCKSYTVGQGAYAIEQNGVIKKVMHQAYAVDENFIRSIKKVSDISKIVYCSKKIVMDEDDMIFREMDPALAQVMGY